MRNNIQLYNLVDFARKYNIDNPYDKSEYDYIYAWKNNITPNEHGIWPKQPKGGDNEGK